MIGGNIGPYRILERVGAGGMGEVYRARDTSLNRDVAIKVLPAAFAQESDSGSPSGSRVARLRREAQLLASLNHPNIAAIYGLEERDGTVALALELVEGDDLTTRMARGAMPVTDAIAVARQIAEGLEAAHEKGVIHRDLKPANIKITPAGTVKILDFGLAKGEDPDGGASSAVGSHSQAPTISQPMTEAGMILGTAAYMAPEQARGKAVDRRADIWAFGVVLFEMLSGARLFAGETVSDVLAAVLTREPDWSALRANTPPGVRRLLQRCLDRDPRHRLQAIGEARVLLEDVDVAEPLAGAAAVPPPRRRWPALAAALAGGAALFAAGWLLRPTPRAVESPVRMVDLSIPDLAGGRGRVPVVSPDGTRVAYVVGGRLHVRRLDSLDGVELPESDDVLFPTWAPDSRQLAYVRRGRAWKVSTEGGSPTELGPVPADLVGSGGGAWTSDGRVVFAGSDSSGLWEIPAAGGAGRDLVGLDRNAEADFHEISTLPDGRSLIFTIHLKGRLPDVIAVLSGETRRVILEVPGESLRYPVYSPTGHLLYERETTNPGIWAVPFSLERLETTGAPFLAVPGVSAPSVSRDGTLGVVRTEESLVELVSVSRAGTIEPIATLAGTRASRLTAVPTGTGYRPAAGVRLSPDGTRVALTLGNPPSDLAVYDLSRGTFTNVATGVFPFPASWSPAADRLFYASAQSTRTWNLWFRRADAGGDETRLSTSDEIQVPLALSPDGRWLVYAEGPGPVTGNLFKRSPALEAEAQPLFPSRAWGGAASFSPDGRWLAYESMEGGRIEIYARPFPDGETRVQLSNEGGDSPVWSKSGEVFYHAGGSVLAVGITPRGNSLEVSKPVSLFPATPDTQLVPVFDVTPDGQRFVMLRARGRQHVSLILNWPREIARLRAGTGAGDGR